jgi:hypothetical protein
LTTPKVAVGVVIELRKIEALVALAEDRLADAVDLFTAAAGEASALGHYREAAVSDHNAGESLCLLRRPAEAEERRERSDATAGKHGIAWLVDVNDGTRRFYRAWSDGTAPVLEEAIAVLEAEAVAASEQGRGWTAKNQANARGAAFRSDGPKTTVSSPGCEVY